MSEMNIGIFDPNIVEYAVKLEFGSGGRDFLRVAYDENQTEIADFIEKQYRTIVDLMIRKKKYNLNEARKNVGNFIVNIIKNKIKQKGIIQTGAMLNSVEYKIT